MFTSLVARLHPNPVLRILSILLLITGALMLPAPRVQANPPITFDYLVTVPPDQQQAISDAVAQLPTNTPLTLTALHVDPEERWFHAVLVPSSFVEQGWEGDITSEEFVDVLGRRSPSGWEAWVHMGLSLPPVADLSSAEWLGLTKDAVEPTGYIPAVQLRFPWSESQAWRLTQGWHPGNSLDFAPSWSSNLAVSAAVLAAGEGTLSVICNDRAQMSVRISHPDGTTTGYTHLDSASFRYDLVGKHVVRGQYLGRLYNTGGGYNTTCGYGTGMHLHFTVSHRDLFIDNIHLNEIAAAANWYTSSNPRTDNPNALGSFTSDVHISGSQALSMQRWATRQGGFWGTQRWFVGDFSGDGRQDLLKLWNDGGSMTVDVHVAVNNGFRMERWATRQGGFWDAQRWFVGDFTGDGRADLAKYWSDQGNLTLDVHVSTGSAFGMQRWATQQGGVWLAQKWFVGDFTGDGRQDLLKLWNDAGSMTADLHVSTGTSFRMERWATRQGGFWDAQRWFVGDFSGDGRQDLLKLWNDGGSMTVDVHVAGRSNFTMQRWATRQGGFWDAQRWFVGDFTGDGRADIAKVWNDAGTATMDVHPSSGSSFSMQRWATRQGGFWNAQQWVVGDFNGDRRADVAKYWNDAGSMTMDVHSSSGGWFTMQRWATRQGGMWGGQNWILGDFNGDLRTDLTKLWRDSVATTSVVSSQGQTVALSAAHLQVPAGALTSPASVTLTLHYGELAGVPSDRVSLHTRYELTITDQGSSHAVEPSEPITLTIGYDADDVALLNEKSLAVYAWNGTEWVSEAYSNVDSDAKTVTVVTRQPGPWAVFGTQTWMQYLPVVRP